MSLSLVLIVGSEHGCKTLRSGTARTPQTIFITWVNVFIALRNDATREARGGIRLGLMRAIFALLLLANERFVRITLVRTVVAYSYVIYVTPRHCTQLTFAASNGSSPPAAPPA
jgi:hypothetical protein